MWLIHTVGKCGRNWKIAWWIPSPLPTKNAIKHVHICLPENPNKARTQLWNLAFFFCSWSTVCPIFHCQNMYWKSFIWVISFHNTVIEVSWLTPDITPYAVACLSSPSSLRFACLTMSVRHRMLQLPFPFFSKKGCARGMFLTEAMGSLAIWAHFE